MISIKEKIFQITRETISEFELIHKKDKIIIGISGGADSLSLFLILNEFKKEYDLTLLLAHMNHKLRGLESDEDQKFIIRLAQKYKTPVKIKTVDIPALKTKNKKLSLEEIAHHERSEFFLTLLKKEGYNSIALGHNLDDSVENFFLRACNLSSLRSISGIKPKQGSIIRPLTNCLKKDLEEFAGSYNIRIRKDRSNGDNSIPRNWIRNKMVPYIEKNYKPIKKQVSHLLNILYY
ncbi:MAG: tRNA lysidine(34) synthetase TilS, partial [Spirochaetes bacterium]|nr:tRNA lysidine(34) synthetase TilS [Spirochaetota bacterium]